MKKTLILGHARHGKDTFAGLLYPEIRPTSMLTLEIFLFDLLKKEPFGQDYETINEAFLDRKNHRQYWYEAIKKYNSEDNYIKLVKEVLKIQPVYVGIRAKIEYENALKSQLFDQIFWVDRSKKIPLEPRTSMTIDFDPDKMIYIDNNGTLEDLKKKQIK